MNKTQVYMCYTLAPCRFELLSGITCFLSDKFVTSLTSEYASNEFFHFFCLYGNIFIFLSLIAR